MIEIFDKKFFLKTAYKITREPISNYSEDIKALTEWSYSLGSRKKVSQADIAKLERLIEKYPEVMAFRNHLVICYSVNGKGKTTQQMAFQLLEDFPDYDFAKFNVIEILIGKEDYEGASKIFGETRRAEDFFKDEIIHISAFRAFQMLATQLDIEEEKLNSAEERLNWVEELEPDEKDIIKRYRYLIVLKRLEAMKERVAEAEKIKREVKSFPTVVFKQTGKPIQLKHSAELSSFYDTDWKTVPDNFEQILALPQESLVEDLENILLDSIQRSELFEGKDESLTSFPIHAAYFLGYLESEKSLDTILNIFRQGEDFLTFWYGDVFKSTFLPALFKLAKTKVEWDKLKTFLLEENISFESKSIVTKVIRDLILAEKMPREEALSLFQSTTEYILKNIDNENFIDTMFISSMIGHVVDARLMELLPSMKQLYDNNLVDNEWAGTYEMMEKNIPKEVHDYDIKVQPTILEEFYNPPKQKENPEFKEMIAKALNDPMFEAFNSLLSGKGLDDEDDEYEDEYERPARLASSRRETFIREDKKVGRNDPCPCGSGKKYKKCHG
jgi:hypothetical protein